MNRSRLKYDALALSLFFTLIFLALSLLSYDPADPPSWFVWPPNDPVRNLCGTVGATVALSIMAGLGAGALVLLVGLVLLDVLLFIGRPVSDKFRRLGGWLLILAGTCALGDKIAPESFAQAPLGSGGYLGVFLTGVLESYFSTAGSYLILTALLVFGVLLSFDYLILLFAYHTYRLVRAAIARVFELMNRRPVRPKASPADSPKLPHRFPARVTQSSAKATTSDSIPIRIPDDTGASSAPYRTPSLDAADGKAPDGDQASYQLPPLDLLEDPIPFAYAAQEQQIRAKATALEDTLAELLAACKQLVPRTCRINRIMRDIPAGDIAAGVKRSNMRQIVQQRMPRAGQACQCIRCREVRNAPVSSDQLDLNTITYHTDHSRELFLSNVTPDDQLAGYLRLSLPDGADAPIDEISGHALIRQVQVHGPALPLGNVSESHAQHSGIGTRLLGEAKTTARQAGYTHLSVIAAVGTRHYYQRQGFQPGNLYMTTRL